MINFEIADNKIFMNMLLKENIFDNFEVRNIEIHTFAKFEISGLIDKTYFSLAEQEFITHKYCIWKDLKSIVFQMIKGNKLPKFIKIIFSYEDSKVNEICENAAALFLNIIFENNKIVCTTGCSEKNFSLDKKVENEWDLHIKEFFKTNNIAY